MPQLKKSHVFCNPVWAEMCDYSFFLFVRLISKNCLFEQDFRWQLVRSINRLSIPPKIPRFALRNAKNSMLKKENEKILKRGNLVHLVRHNRLIRKVRLIG